MKDLRELYIVHLFTAKAEQLNAKNDRQTGIATVVYMLVKITKQVEKL